MNLAKIISKTTIELSNCGIATADIDTRVLLRHILDKDDVYLISHSEDLITNSQYQKFRRYIRRRKNGEPIAYIVGHKEFYGIDFAVNKNVLIPRPETEVLVENALLHLEQRIKNKEFIKTDNLNIVDVGTGSGCIIISLVKNFLSFSSDLSPKFYATDISPKALTIAKKNAKRHQVYDNIRFFKSDLFSNPSLPNKFDLIIANLPYLDDKHYKDKDHGSGTIGLDYEPKEALFAKSNGFSLIKKFILELPQHLTDNGFALIEAAEFHKQQIVELAIKLDLIAKPIKNSFGYYGFFEIRRS